VNKNSGTKDPLGFMAGNIRIDQNEVSIGFGLNDLNLMDGFTHYDYFRNSNYDTTRATIYGEN
jgi:hypothetical protein